MKSWLLITQFLTLLLVIGNVDAQALTPGDGIRLTFYNITDDVSGDFFVQPDGHMQLPYIGSVNAAGRNLDTLKTEIRKKYKTIYRDPELLVQPLYKIKIFGEVRTPGLYYLTGVEKLSDLLALAGGETPNANMGGIHFIHNDKKVKINAREILEKGSALTDIGLQSGMQLYIPRKRLLSFRNAGTVISALALVVTVIGLTRANP